MGKEKIFLILFFSVATQMVQAQKCHEDIKYLSTFIDSRMLNSGGEHANWKLEDLSTLSKQLDTVEMDLPNFYVPVLMLQLQKAEKIFQIENRERTVALLNLIRKTLNMEIDDINIETPDEEICSSLEQAVKLYHEICEDDSIFHKFILTFDDGPYYGLECEAIYPLIDSLSLVGIESMIYLRSFNSQNTLELVDNMGRVKWRKRIARSEHHDISVIQFADNPIRVEDDLGFKIGLHGDGEYLHLYLDRVGDFRMFYHSW